MRQLVLSELCSASCHKLNACLNTHHWKRSKDAVTRGSHPQADHHSARSHTHAHLQRHSLTLPDLMGMFRHKVHRTVDITIIYVKKNALNARHCSSRHSPRHNHKTHRHLRALCRPSGEKPPRWYPDPVPRSETRPLPTVTHWGNPCERTVTQCGGGGALPRWAITHTQSCPSVYETSQICRRSE